MLIKRNTYWGISRTNSERRVHVDKAREMPKALFLPIFTDYEIPFILISYSGISVLDNIRTSRDVEILDLNY